VGEITIRQDGWSGPWHLGDGYCGHCTRSVAFKESGREGSSWSFQTVSPDPEGEDWLEEHRFIIGLCPRPTCARATVVHEIWSALADRNMELSIDKQEIIYPLASVRSLLPNEVPSGLRALYEEAARIEYLSTNGAAFLGRRLLEQVLRTALDEHGQLAGLIDRFLERNALPGHLADLMHDVRQFGNIAAHPAPTSDGGWIDVDQEEATYVLDVVSELLEHVYVRPMRQAAMRERWQAKRRGETPVTPLPSRIEVVPATAPPDGRGSPFEEDDDLPF
jgi:hypothetical protein